MTPARPFPTSGSARETIRWPRCQTRKRSNGKTDFYHSMLAATLVAPGHNMVVPLTPEFIVKPDGAEKQDCERNAAKHWLAAHAARAKAPRPVYLVACQPFREAVLASGADFLFTAKERRRATARAPRRQLDRPHHQRRQRENDLRRGLRHLARGHYLCIRIHVAEDGKDRLGRNSPGGRFTGESTSDVSSLSGASEAGVALRPIFAPGDLRIFFL